MFDSKESSEDDRGKSMRCIIRRTSRQNGKDGGKSSEGCRLYKCRNRRISVGTGRFVLFYGDEHKDTGRTSGDGVRDRNRSDQRADTDC